MVVTTAAAGPTENRITTGIRYANAGTICIASSTGVIARWKRSERPAMTPSGMPTRSESDTAASMSASVCMLGSHRPISANNANAPSTQSAARQPPKRSTISTKAAVVPTQVMSSKSSFSRLTRSSRKELKPLKIENTKLGSSALRLSVSQTWKSSRYPVSEFHSSHAGHGNSLRQAKDATSIAPTIAADWTSRPRHQAGARRRRRGRRTRSRWKWLQPSLACDRPQDGVAVDDADTPAVVDCRHR